MWALGIKDYGDPGSQGGFWGKGRSGGSRVPRCCPGSFLIFSPAHRTRHRTPNLQLFLYYHSIIKSPDSGDSSKSGLLKSKSPTDSPYIPSPHRAPASRPSTCWWLAGSLLRTWDCLDPSPSLVSILNVAQQMQTATLISSHLLCHRFWNTGYRGNFTVATALILNLIKPGSADSIGCRCTAAEKCCWGCCLSNTMLMLFFITDYDIGDARYTSTCVVGADVHKNYHNGWLTFVLTHLLMHV